MQIITSLKKINTILFLFALILLLSSCGKNVDVSGTYKKISGDYRYDTIVIQKTGNEHRPNEFWISTYQDGNIKFKTKSVLEERTLDLGFIAPMKFEPDYKKFSLELGMGSTFVKEITKAEEK